MDPKAMYSPSVHTWYLVLIDILPVRIYLVQIKTSRTETRETVLSTTRYIPPKKRLPRDPEGTYRVRTSPNVSDRAFRVDNLSALPENARTKIYVRKWTNTFTNITIHLPVQIRRALFFFSESIVLRIEVASLKKRPLFFQVLTWHY